MVIEHIHEQHVKSRRTLVLAKRFSELLDGEKSVLDVGCGDGALAYQLQQLLPGLQIHGIDPLVRENTAIEVTEFDGNRMPMGDDSHDYVMFSDVLHHTEDPMVLLREACRVARIGLLIKDHLRQGLLAYSTLRFMDEVGNRRFGVQLPHNYWTPEAWDDAFRELGLVKESWVEDLGLYPGWANWMFGRGLHFICRLHFS